MKRMTQLDFVLALCERGFSAFPRLVLDFASDLGMSYPELGKLLVLFSELHGREGFPEGEMAVSAGSRDFTMVERLVNELSDRELVRCERQGDQLLVSFLPLFARLNVIWQQHLEHRAGSDEEGAVRAGGDGPVAAALLGEPFPAELQLLLRHAERRLGRPLTPREVGDIRDWADSYGFDDEVVMQIFDRAVEAEVKRFSYLNKIALEWHQLGVRTAADLERVQSERPGTLAFRVARSLSLKRGLTQAEQKLLEKWIGPWGFSEELILRACDTTVNIKDPNFRYIDRVLEDWRARGVGSVADVAALAGEAPRGERSRAPAEGAAKPRLGKNFQLPHSSRDEALYERLIKKPRK